jgi:FkbM family methyltransferase
MSSGFSTRAIGAIESLIGRRQLWRLGRLIYRHARRDGHNDPEINGEYALHRKVSRWAAGRSEPFNVIDVGANIGYWSSHLLDECQSAGVPNVNLWAFEPSDEIRAELTSRLESLPPNFHASISAEAVSDKAGQAAFDATPGITGIKHLLTDEALAGGETPSVEVAVTTLTDVFEAEKIEIADFVKSDVEGFDLSALRGAAPLLAQGRIGLYQFEYNHCWISTRSFLRDVFELVEAFPYHVCKVVPGGIDAYEAWHVELETFFETNSLLVRDDLLEGFDVRKGQFGADNTYAANG